MAWETASKIEVAGPLVWLNDSQAWLDGTQDWLAGKAKKIGAASQQ